MKRWFKYARPYLPYFVLGPLCIIIEVIGELVMPRLLSILINHAAAGTLTVANSLSVCLMMVGVALIMMGGGIGGAYFGTKASVNFAADLRRDAYEKIQSYSFSNMDRFSTGSLVARITNDVTQVQNFVNMLLRMALRAPCMMIGGLLMAISLRPSLSVIFAVTIPVMLLTVGAIISTGFKRFQAMQKRLDGVNSTIQENITNIRIVKSFVREDGEKEKFRSVNGQLKKAGTDAMRVMIMLYPVVSILMYATTVAVVLAGTPMVLNNGMAIGDFSAFIFYVNQILFALMMVTMLMMISARAMASARRIAEVLDEKPDLSDETAAYPQLPVKQGSITFRDVSFRYYKTSEEKVLEHINLSIDAGSTVGIIGPTGCGKSTLVSLIPRLYDPDEGQILVDGVDVKDYSLYHLREGVGMVLQKNVLFSGTIAENLQWGDQNASEEAIRHAAVCAQADKFVTSFPNGYDTKLEQGGVNVSGGQKQRLCIARALLKHPRILILDDSTSAVDTATEALIRRTFREDLEDCTKIIIAQRISSVQDADQIVVMNEGRISGIGTHSQLLAENPVYQEIYYSQMDKEEA